MTGAGERALIALGWAEPRVMVNIQGLPVALALLCVALVGCQSLERPFDDGKEWEEPERIENTSKGWARRQQVAIDAAGNAIAVWDLARHIDNRGRDIWASRLTPSGGWETEQKIENDELGDAEVPQISVTPDGTAIVVWSQAVLSHDDIWANRFTPLSPLGRS